jgi:hypothetical protein
MRKKIIFFEVITAVVSIVITVVLHLTGFEAGIAIAIGLAAEVLVHLFAITIRYGVLFERMEEASPESEKHPYAMLRDLSGRFIPLQLLTSRPTEWFLQDHFDNIIQKLYRDLKDLSKKRYKVPMDDLLEPSFRVCREIQYSAFCTALEQYLTKLFDSEEGAKLKHANYEAAKRLKDKGGFCRLFIFTDLYSVNKFSYDLMRENSQNGIEVRAILRPAVENALREHQLFPAERLDEMLDFGLWDNKYVMRVTKGEKGQYFLHVTATDEDLRETRAMVTLLRNASEPWPVFLKRLRQPLYTEGGPWSSFPERIKKLPGPAGPYQEDVSKMLDIAMRTLRELHGEPPRVAIFGLTDALIDGARSIRKHDNFSTLEIDVVDCRKYTPAQDEPGLHFRTPENWLDWRPPAKYDVVLGDDILCNLGLWQIPLFFESLAESIKLGGVFVVRTTAIYTPDIMHPSEQEIANRLKCIYTATSTANDARALDIVNQSAVYEIAWPMLHSEKYYNKNASTFEFDAWDMFVQQLRNDYGWDTAFANRLLLSEPHNIEVTSIDYGELKKMAQAWFRVNEEVFAHSIWDSDPGYKSLSVAYNIAEGFKQYYRIVSFVRS